MGDYFAEESHIWSSGRTHYKHSYYLLKQKDYVNKIFNSLNFDNSELEGFFKQLMIVLNNYIDKRIGVVNA